MLQFKRHVQKQIGLRDYDRNRNRVCILRDGGGLGDILMHRMMFEDFKLKMPDCHLTFACPPEYHAAVRDHPYLDALADCRTLNVSDYGVVYNTSTACTRYEMTLAPQSGLHRSDIWAQHCGLELTRHNMHFRLPAASLDWGKQAARQLNPDLTKPLLLLCPISTVPTKDIQPAHAKVLIPALQRSGFALAALHNSAITWLQPHNVPVIYGLKISQWMGLLAAADYVLTVDTAGFHFAAGYGRPTVGVFTFADGKVYGRHYQSHELVQKHRDNGDWSCGPCYNWPSCPKSHNPLKPCCTELTPVDILDGVRRLLNRFPWTKCDLKLAF